MKRLGLLLALLCAAPSWGAIRVVGTAVGTANTSTRPGDRMPVTDGASSSVASVTLTAPDGLLGDDVCFAFIAVRNAAVTISNTTAGQANSWTANTALQANGLTYTSFYVKLPAGGFTSNPVFGWVTASSYVAWLQCFRGVDTTTALDASEVTASQAAAATYTNGASFITTSTAGAMVVHVFTSADNNTWGSFGAAAQPRGQAQWTNSNTTGTSITVSYVTQASSGGSTSFSASQATLGNDAGIRAAFALKPASTSAESNFASAGHFATGTGSTPVTVSGMASRPKLVIGLETRQTADGAGDGLKQGLGVMAEGHQRGAYTGAVDNVGFGNSVIANYRSAWMMAFDPYNGSGGDTDARAEHVGSATLASTSDGFTFTPTDVFSESGLISYLALGGDDIVQAECADFNLPLGTGSVTYSAEFNFQPSFLFFPNAWSADNAWDQISNLVDGDEAVGFSLGFVDSDLNQGALIGGANSQGSGATTGSSLAKTGSAFLEYDYTGEFNASHALRYDGAVTAITANGFTVNWTTVSGTTSAANLRTVCAVQLSATGKLRVISGSTPTSTGNWDITADVGSTTLSGTTWAGGLFGSGISGTGGTSRAADELFTVGVWDGTNNEAVSWWYDQGGGSSGSVPTDDVSFRSSSLAFAQRSASSAATAVGSATVTSLVDKVRFNFTAVDSSAHTGVGFVFGPAAAGGGGGPDGGTPYPTRTLLGVGL